MYSLARPFLFALDAERAHGLGLNALDLAYRTGTTPLMGRRIDPLPTTAFGVNFPNPVGLAAGLDKNGEHIDALLALGFGFVEIGTITPRPQAGHPRHAPMLDALQQLFDAHAVDGQIAFEYQTRAFVGTLD